MWCLKPDENFVMGWFLMLQSVKSFPVACALGWDHKKKSYLVSKCNSHLSCRLVLLGWGVQTSWPVGSVFPNRSCSDWWAPRLPGCQKATDWKSSLCRKSTLLSHLYDIGLVRELLHEKMDFELDKNFINFINKEFFFFKFLICCLHTRSSVYMVMLSK